MPDLKARDDFSDELVVHAHTTAASTTAVSSTGASTPVESAAGAGVNVAIVNDDIPEGWLPELWRNPFTRALGAPSTWLEHLEALTVVPEHSEAERGLSHTQRRYCCLRLLNAVFPNGNQVDLAERIGMVVRQGYKARDPARDGHRPLLMASAAAIQKLAAGVTVEEADAAMPSLPRLTQSHPPSFTLIGDPGTGKTTITLRTLAGMPQVIEQTLPYATIKQVAWLKVECPSTGGRRQQCIALLAAFDEVLGTRYAERFGAEGKRVASDQMMLFVQHLATLHAVGLIVIDEIQHARQSTEGVKPLINFLVTLVNRLGVPVMLIGTNEARPIVDGAFREARRASGLGQPNWFRMPKGEEWDGWLARLWPYQWTAVPTELTQEISDAIYDESQGIMDIAVKLILLAQMRAISRGEVYDAPEILTAKLFRSVAGDEFALIRPMITALREGRQDLLSKWEDLEPLHQHVERLLCQETGRSARELRYLRDLQQRIAAAEAKAKDAPWTALKVSLVQRGHAPEVVERVVEQASASSAVACGDMLGMVEAVNDLLAAEPAPRPEKVRRPSGGRRPKGAHPDEMCAIAADAEDAVAALTEAGIVATPDQILDR